MKTRVQFRKAEKEDVHAIVEMLADDPLGAKRERFESPLPQSYYDAFESIDSDPNNELVLATVRGRIVGVLQLTFIPSLTYQGGWRALIEGVRERGCHMLQLTTDKTRPDALRFYESLGFTASHEGMKLHLGAS